jgi:hypothetical protein
LIIKLSEKGGEGGFLGNGDEEEIDFHETMNKRRRNMKKVLNTMIVCALVLFFLSISDVFAVDTTKLADKEFKFTGIAKRYDGEAYDGSGQITQGTLVFGYPDDAPAVYTVHNVASDMMLSHNDGLFEYYCFTDLGPYTTGVDRIRSTECAVTCYTADRSEFLTYAGACDAKIVFSSNTAFTGTITIPDIWYTGSPYVLTINGKFVGKYPPVTNGTSLRDRLRNRAFEGVRK